MPGVTRTGRGACVTKTGRHKETDQLPEAGAPWEIGFATDRLIYTGNLMEIEILAIPDSLRAIR